MKWLVSFIVLALPFGWASANAACNPANVQARLVWHYLNQKGNLSQCKGPHALPFLFANRQTKTPVLK